METTLKLGSTILAAAARASALVGITALIAGCGTSSAGGGTAEVVKIAAINWAEGPVKDLGDFENNGVQLAIDEANAAGGVLGHKLVLNRYDEGYSATTFVPSARKALSDGNVVLVGGQEVGACEGIVSVAQGAHMPVVASVCGTAGDISNYPASILARVPAPGSFVAMAHWMLQNKYKRIQMLGADTAFDRLTATQFSAVFNANASTGVQFFPPIYAPFSQPENRAEVTKALASNPDLLYLGVFGQPIVVNAIKDARQAGYNGAILVNEAAFLQPEADDLGALGSGVNGSTGWSADPKVESSVAFVNAYQKRFGSPPEWLGENGYVAMKLVIASMQAANSTDPKKFGAYFRKVSFKDPNGDEVKYDDTGYRVGKAWYLLQDQNGKVVLGAKLPLVCSNTCSPDLLKLPGS